MRLRVLNDLVLAYIAKPRLNRMLQMMDYGWSSYHYRLLRLRRVELGDFITNEEATEVFEESHSLNSSM